MGLKMTQTIRTMADLLPIIGSWVDLSSVVRETLTSHVRTCGLIVAVAAARDAGRLGPVARRDVRLSAIPCDVRRLNETLFRYPPKVAGLSAAARRNAVSGVRRVLRRLGLIEPRDPPQLKAGSVWQPFIVGDEGAPWSGAVKCRFAGWCEANRIEPAAVSQETLSAYWDYIKTRFLSGPSGLLRTIVGLWNDAVATLPRWPYRRLAPPRANREYTLPSTALPDSYQSELQAFEDHLSTGSRGSGPFGQLRNHRPLRPASVSGIMYALRVSTSTLVMQGRPPATITCLADVANATAMKQILQCQWERNVERRIGRGELPLERRSDPKAGNSAHTERIAYALKLVARRWLNTAPAKLKAMAELARAVRNPTQSGITRKNDNRLAQFDDADLMSNRAVLLRLPRRLISKAAKMRRDHPERAARLARTAVAIELLLHVPLRILNLAHLEIGKHLIYGDSKGALISRLVLFPEETKNHQQLEWYVGPDAAALIEKYIRDFRPSLFPHVDAPGIQERWLFPGSAPGRPIGKVALAHSISSTIAKFIGVIVNPHLFRSFAAMIRLEHSPDGLEDVRLLLGDKSMGTVLRHYAAFSPKKAARRYDEVLRREREKYRVIDQKSRKTARRREALPTTLRKKYGSGT
jgi:integrase